MATSDYNYVDDVSFLEQPEWLDWINTGIEMVESLLSKYAAFHEFYTKREKDVA